MIKKLKVAIILITLVLYSLLVRHSLPLRQSIRKVSSTPTQKTKQQEHIKSAELYKTGGDGLHASACPHNLGEFK